MQPSTSHPPTCATCEAEIHVRPTVRDDTAFCCPGCVLGGPCTCSYDVDDATDDGIRHCLDVVAVIAPALHPRAAVVSAVDGPSRRRASAAVLGSAARDPS